MSNQQKKKLVKNKLQCWKILTELNIKFNYVKQDFYNKHVSGTT